MQKIERLSLGSEAARKLEDLTAQVVAAADPKEKAAELWAKLNRDTKKEIQRTLAEMSSGLERCMYCEDSEGTDIEHFMPKSSYPEDAFRWANYLLACTRCNSNYKRTRFPLDSRNEPLLIDPTLDDPASHLNFSPTTGLFTGASRRGEVTIDICGLNRDICAEGRLNAWTAIEYLIPAYAIEMGSGRDKKASRILRTLQKYPFQSVRTYMARVYAGAEDPALILSPDVMASFSSFPELLH
ncbi:TIGR02646 family protein [Actinomadura spongiicola]|uniref:TIGR02646 family protein n=1 Tax=Actinomadura spongiicola TaxID=2303421 RepID=A0A372G6F9_9ACTN|nr:retron system putative HNH endonuclease [Actinomadura spongiicola]RFS80988.1 TIGR02646 family protein [Actinomadura spongiicola]